MFGAKYSTKILPDISGVIFLIICLYLTLKPNLAISRAFVILDINNIILKVIKSQ